MYSRLCTLSLTVLVCATFSLYPGDNEIYDVFNLTQCARIDISKEKIDLSIEVEELVLPLLSMVGKKAQENSCLYKLTLLVGKPDSTVGNGFISDDNMKVVASELTALKALDISANSFTKDGASTLAATISKSTTLTTLKIADLENDVATLVCLLQGLFYNTTLTKLSMQDNVLSGSPMEALGSMLRQRGCSIVTLDLGRTFINDEDVQCLCSNLLNIDTLKNLKLDRNSLSSKSLSFIGAYLIGNNSVQLLDISDNKYASNENDYAGPTALAVSLSKNSSLTKLCMRANRVNDIGVFAFAELLKVNSTLKVLDLGGNCITDQGARYLLWNAKMCNQVLEIVDLRFNKIQDKNKIKDEVDRLITSREKELEIIWETPIMDAVSARSFGKKGS
jgi:Ran GTPase-activating protein (RanGAP) involved in mRNA processing and transport